MLQKKRKERVYDGVKCLCYNMHHLTTGTGINMNIHGLGGISTYGPNRTLARVRYYRLQYGQYAEMD